MLRLSRRSRRILPLANYQFDIGDSVVVKNGVKDPDSDASIAGWQGRISDIDPYNMLIYIQWDCVTLQGIPEETIQRFSG
jgi:hypothetical protein